MCIQINHNGWNQVQYSKLPFFKCYILMSQNYHQHGQRSRVTRSSSHWKGLCCRKIVVSQSKIRNPLFCCFSWVRYLLRFDNGPTGSWMKHSIPLFTVVLRYLQVLVSWYWAVSNMNGIKCTWLWCYWQMFLTGKLLIHLFDIVYFVQNKDGS